MSTEEYNKSSLIKRVSSKEDTPRKINSEEKVITTKVALTMDILVSNLQLSIPNCLARFDVSRSVGNISIRRKLGNRLYLIANAILSKIRITPILPKSISNAKGSIQKDVEKDSSTKDCFIESYVAKYKLSEYTLAVSNVEDGSSCRKRITFSLAFVITDSNEVIFITTKNLDYFSMFYSNLILDTFNSSKMFN